ncbi:hypothetical protein [Streptomyces sp. Z26]|uniref:hypothetical protein n=1 Tax=Streptomyces sp. Z26 TaxID=2500177 RepID=UPI000EF13DCB|nr:hypothetical protein [Streptomyces sp. Z26]RLL67001.1 hypothetical protein D7M15_09125 [Streptomyces sp. Z26]
MRAAARRAAARLEWRGLAILTSGVAWISYGVHVAVQPRYGTTRGIAVMLDLMPMWGWGVGWIAAGAACLGYAWAPTGRDVPGLLASVCPPLLWAVAYAMGGALGTDAKAWGAVAPWASHAVLVLIVAATTSPRKLVISNG